MPASRKTLQIARVVAPLAVLLSAAYFALAFGVDQKPWWQQAWGFVIGGSVGAIAGLGFFLFVGAVGFVSGPFFGAIGAIGLMASGAIGGLGLGSIVDKAIATYGNPAKFNFQVPMIIAILAAGLLAAVSLYLFLGRRLSRIEADCHQAKAETVSPNSSLQRTASGGR